MQHGNERTVPEKGFTLIEVMVAVAIIVMVLYAGLTTVHQMSAGFLHLTTRHSAVSSLDALEARLRDDAKSAWEVAATTCPAGTDAKIDFYAQDGGGGHFWSYRYVDSVKSVYLIRNQTWTDVCTLTDTAVTAQGLLMIDGLHSFTVQSMPTTTALTDGSSPYINVTGIAARVAAIPLIHGIPDSSVPGVSAGNATLTNVQVENRFAWRSIDLLAGIMPSGYTEALTYSPGSRTLCGIGTDAELAAKCHQGLNLSRCSFVFNPLAPMPVSASPPMFLWVGTVVFTFSGRDSMSITDSWAIYASQGSWNANTFAGNAATPWFAAFPKLQADMNACDSLNADAGLYNNGAVGGSPSISTPSGNYASQAPTQYCAYPYNPATYTMFSPVCTTFYTSAVSGASNGASFVCSLGAPVYAGILLPGYVPISATNQQAASAQLTAAMVYNNANRAVASGCPAVQSGV